MNKRSQIFATAAFTGLLALAPAFAQNQGATGEKKKMDKKGSMGQISSQDRTFTMRAAEGSMMEIELGRVASQKATNPDVKAFAQRMVTDHGKASQRLMTIASQNNITPPATLPANLRAEMDKLTRLSGTEFDRMYMSHMLKHHQKDISDFEKQASKGDNDALQSFARETLPTLREHYQLAQTVGAKVGASMAHAEHGSGNH